MKILLHIIQWQIRQHWLFLSLSFCVVVSITLSPFVLSPSHAEKFLPVCNILLLLVGGGTLSRMIHSQPYVGSESFWMTKPISRRIYLCAQWLVVCLFVVVPALIIMMVTTFYLDGLFTHYLSTLVMWGFMSALVLIAFIVVVATPHLFGGFFLAIASIAVFLMMISAIHECFPWHLTPEIDQTIGVMLILSVTLMLITISQIRGVHRLVVWVACFSFIAPFLMILLEFVTAERYHQDGFNYISQIQIRPQPDPEMDIATTSFSFPLQVSELPLDYTITPWDFRIKSGADDWHFKSSSNFYHGDIHPFFVDRMMAAFPDAVEFNSMIELKQNVEVSEYHINGDQESVRSFILSEQVPVFLMFSGYSIDRLGGLSLLEGSRVTRDGYQIAIHQLVSKRGRVEVEYTLKTSHRDGYLSRNRFDSEHVLYDSAAKRVTLLNNYEDRLRIDALSPNIQGASRRISLPADLVTPTTELYVFLFREEKRFSGAVDAQAGTYIVPVVDEEAVQ